MATDLFSRWRELSADPHHAWVPPGEKGVTSDRGHNSPDHGLRRRKWAPRGPPEALRPAPTRRIDRGQPPDRANMLFVGGYWVYDP